MDSFSPKILSKREIDAWNCWRRISITPAIFGLVFGDFKLITCSMEPLKFLRYAKNVLSMIFRRFFSGHRELPSITNWTCRILRKTLRQIRWKNIKIGVEILPFQWHLTATGTLLCQNKYTKARVDYHIIFPSTVFRHMCVPLFGSKIFCPPHLKNAPSTKSFPQIGTWRFRLVTQAGSKPLPNPDFLPIIIIGEFFLGFLLESESEENPVKNLVLESACVIF